MAGIFQVLKEGGELYFSDVYSDRRVPEAVRQHDILLGECIGGALYVHDFVHIARTVGFTDPRVVSVHRITVGGLLLLVGRGKSGRGGEQGASELDWSGHRV